VLIYLGAPLVLGIITRYGVPSASVVNCSWASTALPRAAQLCAQGCSISLMLNPELSGVAQ
jgi:ACR3 family arsenite efflux pump ArsB